MGLENTGMERINTARMMYTVAEAALLLGIGKSTAHELILRGELQATRLGGRRLISPSVLTELLGERPPPPHEIQSKYA